MPRHLVLSTIGAYHQHDTC